MKEQTDFWKKLGIGITITIWFLGAHGGAFWWASAVNEQLKSLNATLSDRTEDRYRGQEAVRDFALRDQRIDYNTQRINMLNERIANQIAEIKTDVKELTKYIRGNNGNAGN